MKSTALPDNILRRMQREDRPSGNAGLTSQEAGEKCCKKLEREVHKEISRWLNLHNIPNFHSRVDRPSQIDPGLPDYALAVAGVPICLEVKVGGNKLRPEQVHQKAMLEANGWLYHVVSSLPEVITIVHSFLHNDP